MTVIRPKDRDAVLQSLRAGVVPRTGLHLIQVGRVKEVEALLRDIERVADGGSGNRVVLGARRGCGDKGPEKTDCEAGGATRRTPESTRTVARTEPP